MVRGSGEGEAKTRATRLTDKGIERLRPPASGRVEIWDPEFRGFGLRVTGKGAKTFQLMYRFDGKLRRKTIGQYPAIGLADAREAARNVLKQVKAGNDPELAEAQAAADRKRARANTFGAVVDQFIDLYAKPKNKSWEEVQRYFERDLADWKKRPIGSITRRDVIEALDRKAKEGGPYAANRLRAHVRKLFNWSIGRDLVPASPVVNVPAAGTERERDRVLDHAEIGALWKAWGDLGFPFGPMFRLLLVTGQRRDEVASMQWPDIRPRATEGASAELVPIEWVWTIEAARTKAGRSHEVPLSPLAMEIVGSVPRTASSFVFHARGEKDGYASGFSRAKARCDQSSGITDWRLHDLRRTCGTGMAAAGIAVSTVSRVLNHAEGGVTKIYNRYSYGQEKRHALETWARALESIVRPAPENVVSMPARAAV